MRISKFLAGLALTVSLLVSGSIKADPGDGAAIYSKGPMVYLVTIPGDQPRFAVTIRGCADIVARPLETEGENKTVSVECSTRQVGIVHFSGEGFVGLAWKQGEIAKRYGFRGTFQRFEDANP